MSNKIRIDLYGAMRDFDENGFIEVDYIKDMTISDVKVAMVAMIGAGEKIDRLMKISVLADDDTIYRDTMVVEGPCKLAILPPVAGG